MINSEREQEVKDYLANRYTAAELAEFLGIPVEDLIEEYWDRVVRNLEWLME